MFTIFSKIYYICLSLSRLSLNIIFSLFFQVFILGFGNIGVELAKRLRPFGVKIIATKRSWASHSQVSCQSSGMLGPLSDGETHH